MLKVRTKRNKTELGKSRFHLPHPKTCFSCCTAQKLFEIQLITLDGANTAPMMHEGMTSLLDILAIFGDVWLFLSIWHFAKKCHHNGTSTAKITQPVHTCM
jgi:hypothetical protein